MNTRRRDWFRSQRSGRWTTSPLPRGADIRYKEIIDRRRPSFRGSARQGTDMIDRDQKQLGTNAACGALLAAPASGLLLLGLLLRRP